MDEIALIRETINHYGPVFIASLSIQIRRAGVQRKNSAVGLVARGGFGVACAAIEGLSRTLAGELSPQGVRVVCLRPHRIGDTLPMDPEFPKMERESFRQLLEGLTLLKRLPTLAEVADTAAFLASDRAGAITGTVANLTCGSSVD